MKKTLLFSVALLLTNLLLAQDVCAELMKFNDYNKNAKRTMRMTSKTEAAGQTMVMERDQNGNIHQTMTMVMMNMEMIISGTTMYMKQGDADWQIRPMDSTQIAMIKNKAQNSQLQFFKNCKKLDNETHEGKVYRVYTGDFDIAQMKEMMKKSAENVPLDAMAEMDMKLTFFINAKDDLEKSTMTMNVQGQAFETEMVYEYDMPITVTIPNVAKKE